MNPRKPIADLELAGSPNLRRAQKRKQADAEKPPLTIETKNEIAELNGLIQKAMRACRRGQTVAGKRNPAFGHLATLIKLRRVLSEGRMPMRPGEDLLAEVDQILKGVN